MFARGGGGYRQYDLLLKPMKARLVLTHLEFAEGRYVSLIRLMRRVNLS